MTGFLTIISKNYLPYARVLMRSVQRWHPDVLRVVVLTDEADGYFDPKGEPFEILHAGDVDEQFRRWFAFRYTVLEFNTAVKPTVLAYAFEKYGLDKLFYLDPDIKLYAPLSKMEAALDRHSILLTPHLAAPLPDDGKEPGELDILRSGTYNLGFVALRRSETTDRLLSWWKAKLERGCKLDFEKGLFVDQRWMDLVPGLFAGTGIWREPGYNVAYWNLHSFDPGVPLYFFHFSGFDVAQPERFSKYQNRFRLSDLGPVEALALEYAAELREAGLEETRHWPYTYRYLADGTPIPDLCRTWEEAAVDDPFRAEATGAFYRWWNAPSGLLTRFTEALCRTRADLHGRDQEALLVWLLHHGKHEFSTPEALLEPLRETQRQRHPRNLDGSAIAAPPDPPVRWPGLPVVAERIYESRPDLQQTFPLGDRAGFTRWLLTGGAAEYDIEQDEQQRLEAEYQQAVADLPSPVARLRHTALRRLARPAAIDPATRRARRRELFQPPLPPLPTLVVDAEDALLSGFVSLLSEGDPQAATLRLTRQGQCEPLTIQYLYTHFAGERLSFPGCREVWTPSTFLQDAYGPVLDAPLLVIPPPLEGIAAVPHVGFTYLAVCEEDDNRENLAFTLEAFRVARPAGARLRVFTGAKRTQNPSQEDSVEFVSGPDLAPHLATADCFLAFARSDGFGLALGRALASGLPCICTAYAGHLDLVRPGTAYLIDYRLRARPGTSAVWAEPVLADAVQAIRAVHADAARRAGVAAAGMAFVDARYSPAVIAERLRQRLRAAQQSLPSK